MDVSCAEHLRESEGGDDANSLVGNTPVDNKPDRARFIDIAQRWSSESASFASHSHVPELYGALSRFGAATANGWFARDRR